MTDGGTLPRSEEVEAALVARLLVDPAQLPVLAGRLSPHDFYSPTWRRAYAGMQKLAEARKSIDIVALQAEIGDEADELARRLGEITAAYRAPLEEYAELVRGFAFRRLLIGRLESLATRAYMVGDREQLLTELHEAVVAVSAGIQDDELLSPDQAADLYKLSLGERSKGGRGGLDWPLPTLNHLLLPAQGGEMIIIAARPSVGKTALAEMVADHWAKSAPFPILFASLEMSLVQLLDRTVSRETLIPLADIVQGILTDRAMEAVLDAVGVRRLGRLWYVDNPFATTSSVRAAAAKARLLTGGLSGIVIDYIQLLKDPGESEVQRVTKISRVIKGIAREFDVPVLALSQLNRSVTAREDKRPQLHDLRESGALEQDADRVIALSRPIGRGETNLEVLKARQGPVGFATLWFDGEHVRFQEPQLIIEEEIGQANEADAGLLDQL